MLARSPFPSLNPGSSPRRLLITGALVAAGLGAAAFGQHWWSHGRFLQSTDDAYVGGEVTVIAPKVPGYLAEVTVTDNQQVHGRRLAGAHRRSRLPRRAGQGGRRGGGAAGAAGQSRRHPVPAGGRDQPGRAAVTAVDADTARARDDQARYQQPVGQVGSYPIQSSQQGRLRRQAVAGQHRRRRRPACSPRSARIDVIATQKPAGARRRSRRPPRSVISPS
ncbi:hypothetical protein ACU4GD_30895 [Cupriavidus basilensis]